MMSTIKSYLRSTKVFLAAVMLLIGLTAYGLGYESGSLNTQSSSGQSAAIIFTDAPEQTVPSDAIPVVASRGGTKYHRLDCPGASSIKEANKIYFDSIDLAQAAGYLPAKNCSGL